MSETFLKGAVELHCGDCLDVLDAMPENSLDAGVTDPPYHFESIVKRFGGANAAPAKDVRESGIFSRTSAGFMGKQWDGGDIAFRPETWAKVLRVLKPGAHLLAFSAPRYVGRMQVAIEAAGFETRDCLLDIIDLDPAVEQFVASLNDAQRGALFSLVNNAGAGGLLAWLFGSGFPKSHPTALEFEKRLCDAVDVGGKTAWRYKSDGAPMSRESPYRSNLANAWAGFGTALKPAFEPIVLARKPLDGTVAENVEKWGTGALNIDACRIEGEKFPADVLLGDAPSVRGAFPCENGVSAARFYYTAKADANDRIGSKHPTVKPLDLMQYLVRLVTAPGQTVLDLFAGTGTTGEAAFREGRRAVLIERESEYQNDIRRRMRLALGGPEERARESLKASGKAKDAADLPLFA